MQVRFLNFKDLAELIALQFQHLMQQVRHHFLGRQRWLQGCGLASGRDIKLKVHCRPQRGMQPKTLLASL